ncbi:hypothetical protein B0T14DRAFT_535127 [Immersiella caudata]|uniref:Nucleotidyltransferase family protein n=1 Tax=Immersiella caudata TaxID=314043 RepID=A0AA39X4K1_9PEZI|nr:hypothetical protein B0T14DRAFT_535127 [Immersiella caudata]
MAPQELHLQAANALSAILSEQGIDHGFIGGFAVNLLGCQRNTADIDVEIDFANIIDLRTRIADPVLGGDPRFRIEHNKFVFTPADQEMQIPIETLVIDDLGLPRQLSVIRPGNTDIPILRPGILVLTKIKQCIHFVGGTRPKSITKLRWLAEHGQQMDFVGYSSLNVDRLYLAVKSLREYWKGDGRDDLIQLLDSVLEVDDQKKVSGA